MVKIQALRMFAWASQTVNVWLLLGHHDQTVSSRCYLNRNKPIWSKAYKIINALFFWQENHCRSSFEADVAFAEEIMSLKNGH